MPVISDEDLGFYRKHMLMRQEQWGYVDLGNGLDVVAYLKFQRKHLYMYEDPKTNKKYFTMYESLRKPTKTDLTNWFTQQVEQDA